LAQNRSAGWRPLGEPPRGYRYTDARGQNGPVRILQIKEGRGGEIRVVVVINGALGPGPQPKVSVIPPNPGTDGGFRLAMPGGGAFCMRLGGIAGGEAVSDDEKRFRVLATQAFPSQSAGCPEGTP
jgi:hypothetical protein